jgi:hypothetical protein
MLRQARRLESSRWRTAQIVKSGTCQYDGCVRASAVASSSIERDGYAEGCFRMDVSYPTQTTNASPPFCFSLTTQLCSLISNAMPVGVS